MKNSFAALMIGFTLMAARGEALADGPVTVVLAIAIEVSEGGLVITERLEALGDGPVDWPFPLLEPESRTDLSRSEPFLENIEIGTQGDARVVIEKGVIRVSGTAGPSFAAEIRYLMPLSSSRVFLRLAPAMTLDHVHFIVRRSPPVQVRPLVPYAVRSDGEWAKMTLVEPIGGGSMLRVHAGHLPYGPRPMVVIVPIAALAALAACSRSRG